QRQVNDVMEASEYVYELERFENFSGHPFPTKFSIVSVKPAGRKQKTNAVPGTKAPGAIEYDDYPHRVITQKVDVVDVQFNQPVSAGDFQLTLKIPDGHIVRMVDAPQVKYRWYGGQIVPASDARAVEAAKAAAFQPAGAGWGRFWLVTGNFVALGVVVCIVVCNEQT
ncbi:MAG: hypothetical protein L0Z53_19070, partial [Acidobacteriales bacterium]|nr:hypothetical protein [Terriglobales bacterium]